MMARTRLTPSTLPASIVPPYLRHSGLRSRIRRREAFSDNVIFLPAKMGLSDISTLLCDDKNPIFFNVASVSVSGPDMN
jgi:hypothetical protein